MTLLDRIKRHSTDRVLVVENSVARTAGDLQAAAERLRAVYSAGNNHIQLVRAAGVWDFVTQITAYDGLCPGILLLANEVATDILPLEEVTGTGLSQGAFGESRWWLATSGTTGTPKLIGHTLKSLTRSVRNLTTDHCWGLLYEPTRFAGLQVILQALFGGTLVSAPVPDLSERLREFRRCQVNALSATPTMWRKILMDPCSGDLEFTQVTLGGEIADQAVLDALALAYPKARRTHIYASTEAGVGFSVKDGKAGFPADWLEGEHGGVELRVREDGHLLIKSPRPPMGREITSRMDGDGFMDTQDLVRVDSDRVFFLGRATGAINVGGNKVVPEEVEDVIRSVPGVVDVRVAGVKSPIVGQLVADEVCLRPEVRSEEVLKAIRLECVARLERYKVPAKVSIVGSLEATAAGKLLRIKDGP